jgi:hypothetical protein
MRPSVPTSIRKTIPVAPAPLRQRVPAPRDDSNPNQSPHRRPTAEPDTAAGCDTHIRDRAGPRPAGVYVYCARPGPTSPHRRGATKPRLVQRSRGPSDRNGDVALRPTPPMDPTGDRMPAGSIAGTREYDGAGDVRVIRNVAIRSPGPTRARYRSVATGTSSGRRRRECVAARCTACGRRARFGLALQLFGEHRREAIEHSLES